jgi:uncharacterized membrane protein
MIRGLRADAAVVHDAGVMAASTLVFLVVRAAHVLFAAVWVGATVFISTFLFPSLQESGPAAGPVMAALMRRKIQVFQASLGGIAVVSGLYLYYRFTGGFDPALSGTRAAMVFGTGGLCGLAALIIGGAVVSKNAKQMASLGARLSTAPDAERGTLAAQMARHRSRAAAASRIVVVLQLVAIVLMAIGHYV